MLKLTHIAETVLYVDDLNRAVDFYIALFGCPVIRRDERIGALRIAPGQMLLLFQRGASLKPAVLNGGVIPPHDGAGPLHVCFGIEAADASGWDQHLQQLGIEVESRVHWPGGAISLYFRDPDGHAVELATPGLWSSV